jgi:hypothetical protein
MDSKKLDELITQVENYLECWKQFNNYLAMARTKKFGPDDEHQFLELKSVLAQELELIFASVECSSPSKEEVHALVGGAPSLRSLGEQTESSMRNMENQWHKIYIGWQSILGQLKVQQRQAAAEPKSFWSTLFGRKKN